MPTYAYTCTACAHSMEVKQSFTDDALTECPECSGRLRKVFSNVGVVFKGSGFYRNDSRAGAPGSGSAGKGSSDGGGSEKSGSDGGGTSGSEKSGSSDGAKSGDKPAPAAASTPSASSGSAASSSPKGSGSAA